MMLNYYCWLQLKLNVDRKTECVNQYLLHQIMFKQMSVVDYTDVFEMTIVVSCKWY